MGRGAQLAWVIVDGEARHVSDFASSPASARPRALCPECGEPLTLKLGRVRVHHAAHRPGAHACVAIHPETALHLNLKYHIARELLSQAGQPLTILSLCVDGPCPETSTSTWPGARWTGVRVEMRVGSDATRRPDIVLTDGERSVAAIEVCVSHAVDDAKAAALAALDLPWIEVRADTVAAEGDNAWRHSHPLPTHRRGPAQPWRCVQHAAAADDRIEAARHTSDVYAARLLDVYSADGRYSRSLLLLRNHRVDGVIHARSLLRDGVELARARADEMHQALPLAYARWKEEIKSLGGFTDSPMRWREQEGARRLLGDVESTSRGVGADVVAQRFPRRFFFDAARARWFQPNDLRDVSWERADDDGLSAHPAWVARRAAFRERTLGSGYSASPVLAGHVRPEHLAEVGAPGVGSELGVTTVSLGLTQRGRGATLIAVSREWDAEAIRRIHRHHTEGDGRCIWLSLPSVWNATLASTIPWVPAGTTQRGWPRVVVDGIGVFRLPEFAKLVLDEESRISDDVLMQRGPGRFRR